MKNAPVNPLSAEFLYELYAAALRYDTLCGVVAENMCKEYLPDRSFQKIQEVIANHYRTYKSRRHSKATTMPSSCWRPSASTRRRIPTRNP